MKTIITIALLLLSNILFAQEQYENVTITFAEVNLSSSKTQKIIKVFKSIESYYIFKKEPVKGPGGWEYFLVELNSNFETITTKKISKSFIEMTDWTFDDIQIVQGTALIFYHKQFKKENYVNFYCQKTYLSSNEIEAPKVIYKHDYSSSVYYKLKTKIVSSPNNKNLLINVFIREARDDDDYYTKDKNEFISYNIDSDTFSNFDLELTEGKYNSNYIQSFTIDNSSKSYITTYNDTRTNSKLKVKHNFKYSLFIVNENISEKKTINLSIGNNILISPTVLPHKDGSIYLVGFYASLSQDYNFGEFLFKIDPQSGELTNEVISILDKEFITKVERERFDLSKKEKEKSFRFINYLQPIKLVEHLNGSISIVNEVSLEVMTISEKGAVNRSHYHNNLVISRLNGGEYTSHTLYKKTKTRNYENTIAFGENNELVIVQVKRKIELLGKELKQLTKDEKKKNAGYAIGTFRISENGSIKESFLMDYMDDSYKTYKRYKELRGISFIELNNNKIELNIITNTIDRKFGFLKFQFDF
ncbi:MAG: hypothetical protein COA33_008420 [Fluviicola sp.]|nr:hypothetical protein [Fluviicola sp.]